ncbi:hypothetical protein N6H18_15015 [Reichenbachiella agarivorans]|uniref:Uncharacterized protein n=1 Tax=Reichenbachiella agarivorans TaxID=2979464 RepID=A0ABY6CQE1_9BACT|nr:hypothetical protein [Reichenbachiella agarivorans]UXP31658.1 hypothetical protein N6H18_15015 [Reichenbachiella agarivorans]
METNKLKVTKEYEKLSDDLKEQLKLVYPGGYSRHLIKYTNKDGINVSALRFETDDKIYLIRMSILEAERIVEEDDDFDDDGQLKEEVRDDYEERHSDVDYLTDNDNYDDPYADDVD